MQNVILSCILAICLMALFCDAVLIGRLRNKEETESNVIRNSRFLYPRSYDDMPCKTDDGLFGQCVDIRFCYAARRAVAAGNHPVRCGWINNYIPMVCCHPEQVQHPKLVFRPYRKFLGNRNT